MQSSETQDAVSRFCAASESNDVKAMVATLAPTAEFLSPISGRMKFIGKNDLHTLYAVVYGALSNLRWTHTTADDDIRIVLGEATIWRVHITDAMVIELNDNGEIQRITPHIRPWLGLTLIALAVGSKMLRHPRVIRRALRTNSEASR